MNIFKKLFKWIKCLFHKCKDNTPQISNKNYTLIDNIEWFTCPKGPSSWNKNAGLEPEYMDNGIIRLYCLREDDDTYKTAAMKTVDAYSDGKFECEAMFNSGKGTWPAIWMSHPNGAKNNYETYYEIDLSEYYETRDTTDTTYHCPQSMRGGEKYIKSVVTPIKKNDWNKFACEWDKDSIRIFINDKLIMVIKNDNDPLHYPTEDINRTFQIILSMQYENRWLQPVDLNELPLWMDVKNIKFYKLD